MGHAHLCSLCIQACFLELSKSQLIISRTSRGSLWVWQFQGILVQSLSRLFESSSHKGWAKHHFFLFTSFSKAQSLPIRGFRLPFTYFKWALVGGLDIPYLWEPFSFQISTLVIFWTLTLMYYFLKKKKKKLMYYNDKEIFLRVLFIFFKSKIRNIYIIIWSGQPINVMKMEYFRSFFFFKVNPFKHVTTFVACCNYL